MTDRADLTKLAAKAYIYGFPIVFSLEQAIRYATEGIGANPAAPYNTPSHARTLAGPKDTFVSINNDTVYTMVQLDLSVGPMVIELPDTHGEYYVAQFIDAWTDNFAYVGKRATGTAAGSYLITPPGETAPTPDGIAAEIRAPTALVSVVVRWACRGVGDLPRVHQLQDAVRITPVDRDAPAATGPPTPDPAVSEPLRFWERLRVWMQAYPPAPRDRHLQQAFEPLGLLVVGESPYRDPSDELAIALQDGIEQGRNALHELMIHGGSAEQNGWKLAYHPFDFNVDFFEVGTVDASEWKLEPRPKAIAERAAAALGGMWGNHGYEAAYAMTWVDREGEPLSGEHSYTLRLAPPPPVDAFWSITMYDLPNFYLVENPIDRYSIGDRTPGLVTADDGSVAITLAHTQPSDPHARANWLPAPPDAFRPILRMYSPAPEVLDGSYRLPPIIRS
jgi:hypothetical protein